MPQRRDCLLHKRQASDTHHQVLKPVCLRNRVHHCFLFQKGDSASSAIDCLEGMLLHSRTKLYQSHPNFPFWIITLSLKQEFFGGILEKTGRNIGENSQDPIPWMRQDSGENSFPEFLLYKVLFLFFLMFWVHGRLFSSVLMFMNPSQCFYTQVKYINTTKETVVLMLWKYF